MTDLDNVSLEPTAAVIAPTEGMARRMVSGLGNAGIEEDWAGRLQRHPVSWIGGSVHGVPM